MVKSILVAAVLTLLATLAIGARAEASPRHRTDASGNVVAVIGGRPAGCPRAYCGCGLAKFLGLTDKRLNLAWNWARFFPHVAAQPGAAAVRRHHVMLLLSPVSNTAWTVRDYNSGGGLSRIHVRDVRGYVFVKPGVTHELQIATQEYQHQSYH